ncbi:uncharacterized protein LOC143285415 [Babylonia areolata]|uniref:uncharacterized protein LOC143285415 n=1 Tax=Babylonia areolata TaxID=304850 RepID=UPI003FCEFBC1
MEYYYFVLVVVIVLKILFWTFYFYIRAQRMRQTQTVRRFIIVGGQPATRTRCHPYSDRSAIIDHAEPVSATGPPPYAEVVKDGSCPLPPPSYDQAMAAPGASSTSTTSSGMQSGGFGEASVLPPINPNNLSAGSSAMPGYGPITSHLNGRPREYPQEQFAGQVSPDAPGVSGGQNCSSVPQQQ